MSAVVAPRCGHASHLMEVDSMRNAPQVHLHFLTEGQEHYLLEYYKVELCCHGCGESTLVYFTEDPGSRSKHLSIRDAFVERHKMCPNHGYENWCPNWRSSFNTIDIRQKREVSYPRPPAARLVPIAKRTRLASRHR